MLPQHFYQISGLTVACSFALPGAIAAVPADGSPDVQVRLGTVPTALGDGDRLGPNWDIAGDDLLLEVPRLARFLIRGGREIILDLEPGGTERDASAYVLGTALGIVLHQRGTLVLHGSAVARDGEAIAICGQSGAGKSTLAAALCARGCGFVTDDMCAVSLDDDDRRAVILPDGRRLKLWQEAIERLELGDWRGEPVVNRLEKYFIAPPTTASEPLPLRAVYLLQEARPPFAEGIEPLALPDAMHVLDRQAYRPRLRLRVAAREAMVAQSAAMLSRVKLFRLVRPRGLDRTAETVDEILAHWERLKS